MRSGTEASRAHVCFGGPSSKPSKGCHAPHRAGELLQRARKQGRSPTRARYIVERRHIGDLISRPAAPKRAISWLAQAHVVFLSLLILHASLRTGATSMFLTRTFVCGGRGEPFEKINSMGGRDEHMCCESAPLHPAPFCSKKHTQNVVCLFPQGNRLRWRPLQSTRVEPSDVVGT